MTTPEVADLPESLHRLERHAHLSDLGVLTEVDRRDDWTAELVEGSHWPEDGSVIVLRREVRGPLFSAGSLSRYADGTYDYSEPMQVEVRITVPARPFTPRLEEVNDGTQDH